MYNNGNNGLLLATAFGNMMADNVFRNIIGLKLLQDENRGNDGVGMALLMNNNPTVIQPSTYRTNY